MSIENYDSIDQKKSIVQEGEFELDVEKNESKVVINAKAMELLVKLKNEELTYVDLPKPQYDEKVGDGVYNSSDLSGLHPRN